MHTRLRPALAFAFSLLGFVPALAQPARDRSPAPPITVSVPAQSPLRSWSIEVGTAESVMSCGGKPVAVPAARNCEDAVKIAESLFGSIRDCAELCPNGRLEAGKPACTVTDDGKGGTTFAVTIPYSCDAPAPARDCDEAAVMNEGAVVFPPGATDIGQPVLVDEDRGLVSDLYPDRDTTTDAFYPLPCEASIGGTLPPDEPDPPGYTEAESYLQAVDHRSGRMVTGLKLAPLPAVSKLSAFVAGRCSIRADGRIQEIPCDSPRFLLSGQPFEGRDIIYVHGLALEHIKKKFTVPMHAANKRWPQDASEFLDSGKYFRTFAENYWRDHIRENLSDPAAVTATSHPIAGWQWTSGNASPVYVPKSNRYLLVAWSSNQTLEYAQHALLTQIHLAITTNKNVVTPPTYPAMYTRPFCSNGCVFVTHSTGGLIVSSGMGLAQANFFGPGGKQIAAMMRAHVAFESAISGSRLATIAVGVGSPVSANPLPALVCDAFQEIFTVPCSIPNSAFLLTSILRDLIPAVAQGVWGPWVSATPVPTVTVAGGHPLGNYYGATKIFLPGLDDGVVTMNSACGNPNPVLPAVLAPSGFTVASLVKAFDFSEDSGRLVRAAKNWLSHKNLKAPAPLPKYLAGGCTPYLSPTGMVMPVQNAGGGTPWDSRRRYPNHYSMLQGSIDHSHDGATDTANQWKSALQQAASVTRTYKPFLLATNNEESRAVTNSGIYQLIDGNGTHLVSPAFARMREVVRGRKVSFKLFGKKRTWWIWKRTYHLLDKWESKQSTHYVYEFVGRR